MRYLFFILFAIALFANEDLKLIKLALENGLKPIPSNFEALLKALDISKKELSTKKIILGKKLFFEKELSKNRDISCASCHSFDKGGADAKPTAIGHKNRQNPFHLNSPTVFNTAFSKNFFWDGRSQALQDQAKGPLQAPFEMAITDDLATQRIKAKKEYQELFYEVYGENSINFENIVNAIASYEKTIVTRGRYDEFLLGEFDALTKEEKKGLNLFITKSCVACHNGYALGGQVLRKFPLVYHEIWSMTKPLEVKKLQEKYLQNIKTKGFENSINKAEYLKSKLTKNEYFLIKKGFFNYVKDKKNILCTQCHKEDIYKLKNSVKKEMVFPFENKGGFLGKNSQKYFRVPLLRNIVRTKPYFHNGGIEKLEDAIKLMGRHQSRSELKGDEVKNIISFLKAVDGELIEYEY